MVIQDSQLIDNKNVASTMQPEIPAEVEAEIKTKTTVKKAADPTPTKEELAINNVRNKQAQNAVSKGNEVNVAVEPTQDNKAFEQAIASSRIENRSSNVVKDEAKDVKFANKSDEQNASVAVQAVFREIDTQENEEENAFYIGSAEINKTKLKGLFKKATRLFERKNNEAEKTLKIAGFEIKSK